MARIVIFDNESRFNTSLLQGKVYVDDPGTSHKKGCKCRGCRNLRYLKNEILPAIVGDMNSFCDAEKEVRGEVESSTNEFYDGELKNVPINYQISGGNRKSRYENRGYKRSSYGRRGDGRYKDLRPLRRFLNSERLKAIEAMDTSV